MEKITSAGKSRPKMKMTTKGKVIAADMEPNETYRVGKNTTRNTPRQINTAKGAMAVKIPARVAMPFPPLKRAKTGKTCPTNAMAPSMS